MEVNGKELSYIQEQYLTQPGFANEMAAAHLALEVSGVIDRAITLSGISIEDLAEGIHGTPERVEELIEADGNIKIASLARMLHVMGFSLKLELLTETMDEYGTLHHEPVPSRERRSERRRKAS